MLASALTEPRFDREPVERIRGQILSMLARNEKDPNRIARQTWAEAMYPDHPYGWPTDGTPEGIAAVTPDDLHRYMRERIARSNLTIGVAGDITAQELAPLLDATFGSLSETAVLDTVPDVEPKAAGQVVIEHIAIPQSVVAFGQEGMKRADPDYYAAYIVNEILGGGGFGSRLTEEVREKRGLAYGIYTYLLPLDHSALMAGGVGTQNARVAETIQIIRDELERMREDGPTEKELDDAKTYLTGSFPLRFDSNGELASYLVGMQLEDLGIDYLDKRNSYIEAVTLDDAKRVAKALIDPANLAFVVVGDPEELAETETH